MRARGARRSCWDRRSRSCSGWPACCLAQPSPTTASPSWRVASTARLLTAHLVHHDLQPSRLEPRRPGARRLAVRARVHAARLERHPRGFDLAVDLGFLVFEPQLQWYVGFSRRPARPDGGRPVRVAVALARRADRAGGRPVRVKARLGALPGCAAFHGRDAGRARHPRGPHLWRPGEALPRPCGCSGASALQARRYNRAATTPRIIPGRPAACRGKSPMTLAFVFPGQGSQSVGMLAELGAAEPIVRTTFAEASEVLGYDLWTLCQSGPEADLGSTERTQPAMLAAGVATWRVWIARGGPRPAAMAGHSLGEYTALVCSNAMDFRTAIDVVRFRGQVMQQAVPLGQGAMAAILGLEDADLAAACSEAAQGEVVEARQFQCAGADRDCRQRHRRGACHRGCKGARCQARGAAAGQRAVAQQPDAGRGRAPRRKARQRRRAAAGRRRGLHGRRAHALVARRHPRSRSRSNCSNPSAGPTPCARCWRAGPRRSSNAGPARCSRPSTAASNASPN